MAYFRNMKNLRTRIRQNKKGISEEDVRLSLNQDIGECLKKKFNREIHFHNEKKLKSDNRRIDSAFGNFIIEYKKPSIILGEKELNQILDYMADYAKYGNKEEVWGILTNGEEVIQIEYDDENRGYNRIDDKSGILTDDKIEDICRDLAVIKKVTLNKRNINDYLGLENKRVKEIICILFERLKKYKLSRTLLLYNEWERLTRLSSDKDSWNEDKAKNREINTFYKNLFNIPVEDNRIQYMCLFVVQTYYSIIVKLVLYKYLKRKFKESFNNYELKKELFEEIESTQFYKDHNILNLIDGDFYSWYVSELTESELGKVFLLIEDIDTIETNSLNDTLISFYENIFPFEVRYAMGEYYTPDYLAQEVIDNAFKITGNENIESVLDPTCGSGIFISTVYKSNYNKKVYGIDINPLAVLTAKASLILNNYDLRNETEIPVYLGDSTYSPNQDIVNGIDCYSYNYLTFYGDLSIDVTMPVDLICEKHFFEILDTIESAIKNKDKKRALKIIESYKSSHFEELRDYYDNLFEQLISLEKRNMNSIWLKIIGNYFKAASIKNVDLIVGNPPWVRWSNLPTNYKNEIKTKCKIGGLFSNDTNTGGVDLNIAALIAYVCIRDRLSEKGVLGFLLPDSILNNKSFEGFRKMEFADGRKFYLNKVVIWNGKEKPFKPVTIDFAEFFFSFKKITKVKVNEKRNNADYNMIKMDTSFNNNFIDESIYNMAKEFIGSNKLKFRSGIGLPKGGHFQLEFIENINSKCASFHPYTRVGGKLKVSKEVVVLEKEIIFPYIKSEMIKNKKILKTDYYCIYPYPYKCKEPYTLEEIRKRFPKFYSYLTKSSIQKSISTASNYNKRVQNVKNDLGIMRVGEYTYGSYFLACRDNTNANVSIVSKLKTHWGEEKMPLFDGHVNYVSLNEEGQFLNKKEAEYLFGIFNRKEVQEFILYSANKRSISSRLWNLIKIN